MNEYKTIINSEIHEKACDILIDNTDLYRALLRIKPNKKDKGITSRRRGIQKALYETGFVETFYQLVEKGCLIGLNFKYSPILDALSSRGYDFDGLFPPPHDLSYYRRSKNHDVFEFFANMFEAKVTGIYVRLENLIKYLPKSFEAFEELFSIFYDHIQQNKRFNNVKTRKVVIHDELQ